MDKPITYIDASGVKWRFNNEQELMDFQKDEEGIASPKNAWVKSEQDWLKAHLESKKLREKADKLKQVWIDTELKENTNGE